MTKRIAMFVIMIAGLGASAQPPGLIDYQGRIAIAQESYDGVGYFKLAISDAGNTNVWTHDGTGIDADAEPTGHITNAVNAGVFSLMLGDTTLGMTALTTDLFETDTRYLRVWFATNATETFSEMLPAQRLTAVPYALSSGVVAGIQPNSIGAEQLAKGCVSTESLGSGVSNLLFGAVQYSELVSQNTAFLPGSTQTFSTARASSLAVGSSPTNFSCGLVDTFSVGAEGGGMVVERGRGYTISREGGLGKLAVFDLSDPAAPIEMGSTSNSILKPSSLCVEGDYAYVADYQTRNGFFIFDVSDPNDPTLVGGSSDGLWRSTCIDVQGDYAYISAWASFSPMMVVFDVSDPSAPVRVASIPDEGNLDMGWSVSVRGDYAYLGVLDFNYNDQLITFDISTPTNPVETSRMHIKGPLDIDFKGDYAYAAAFYWDRISVLDVSDPSAPSLIANKVAGHDGFGSVRVEGDLLFATAAYSDELVVCDISQPRSPVEIFATDESLAGPSSLDIHGQYVYVSNDDEGDVSVFECTGVAGTLDVDIANIDILEVSQSSLLRGNAVFERDVAIDGNLEVSGTITGSAELTVIPSGDLLMGPYTNRPSL